MQQTQTDKEKKKRQPATVKKQPDKQPAEQRGWGPAALSVVFFVFVILHLLWGDEQDSGIYAITAMFFAFLSGDYFSKARQNRRRLTLIWSIAFLLLFLFAMVQYILAILH